MELEKKSFLFFGEIIDPHQENNIQLIESFYLKKANHSQIDLIKEKMDYYFNPRKYDGKIIWYENAVSPMSEKQMGVILEALSVDNSNYWIIEHDGNQIDLNFRLALALSEVDLTVLIEVLYPGLEISKGVLIPDVSVRSFTGLVFFYDYQCRKKEKRILNKQITEDDQRELREIYSLLKNFENHKTNFDFIDKALKDFLSIKDISIFSPFRILSYFPILESLLTTYPSNNANDNSIKNQLKKKITLLNNQILSPIDFTHYFKGPSSNTLETIIEALYKYRNDIAHGNKSDFEDKLKLLKNKESETLNFLHTLLRKLLIKAIEHPQLVKDLKDC